MKNTCDFHPTKTAHFYCDECDLCFCPECVTKRELEQYGAKKLFYYCPKCEGLLDRVSASEIVTPFWLRLHKFFLYPFSLYPLILIVVLSLSTFLYVLPFIGFIVQIAAGILLIKYSFEVLLKTAEGSFTPPELNSRTLTDDILIAIKQIVLYVILVIIFLIIIFKVGLLAAFLYAGFVLLLLPSMLIVLVTTNSLLNALNPMLFVTMAWRIGWGYLLMYLFLILIVGAYSFIIKEFIIPFIPTGLHQMVAMAANCYYTIMGYHLMGYVLMQYHDRIGYEVELDENELASEVPSSTDDEAMGLLNRVDVLIKEGNTDDAIYAIKNQAAELLSHPELSERYFNLLKVRGRVSEMLDHGRDYLDLLSKSGQKEKLCEVYLECASKSKEFIPSASSLFKIASALNERGRPKDAVRLYNRFVKSDPKNSMVPKAYYLGATIIYEKLKDPKKAAGILMGLIKKFPNHEIVPYAMRSLKQIKGA